MAIRVCFAVLWLGSVVFAQTPPAKKQDPPCIVDAEETGVTRLRRGKPADRNAAGCETLATPIGVKPEEEPDAATPIARTPADAAEGLREAEAPLGPMDKVRLRSAEYTSKLPNFLCEQLIRRMQSATRRGNWKLRDTLTVEVAYVDGKEEYRNAKRNGKNLKYEEAKASGSWSEGEYGTVLFDLLHPATNADFVYKKKDFIGGVEADLYTFVVEKANSHWKLEFDGQPIQPKYKGSVWVDPKEMLLLRIEM